MGDVMWRTLRTGTKIIHVTASHGSEHDRLAAIRAGADAFIVEPLTGDTRRPADFRLTRGDRDRMLRLGAAEVRRGPIHTRIC